MSRGQRWVLQVGREEDVALAEAMGAGLTASALAVGQEFVRRDLSIAARDGRGQLMGGLTGQFQYAWLYVARLWVDVPHRGKGLGRALLEQAERQAVQEECLGVHLQTYGYQAREFYERLGYHVFAELQDTVPSRNRYFMRRTRLTAQNP